MNSYFTHTADSDIIQPSEKGSGGMKAIHPLPGEKTQGDIGSALASYILGRSASASFILSSGIS